MLNKSDSKTADAIANQIFRAMTAKLSGIAWKASERDAVLFRLETLVRVVMIDVDDKIGTVDDVLDIQVPKAIKSIVYTTRGHEYYETEVKMMTDLCMGYVRDGL